ncbi:MAG: hypothetical protein ACYCQJ_09010 [Nitrososphaerales archaeon]
MSEQGSRNITVKLRKAGWEVEISCTEDQLKQAIATVLSTLESSGQVQLIQKSGDTGTSGNKTCRGLIVELFQDSWFSSERSLAEVHEEIARRGYHYDRTAVSHALRDLVLENVLTRQGSSRSYAYIQKRPPGGTISKEPSVEVETQEP